MSSPLTVILEAKKCHLNFKERAVRPLLPLPACTASFVLEMLTFIAAARPHAWLKILRMWAGNAQVQLGLQHPLSHPLALFACG